MITYTKEDYDVCAEIGQKVLVTARNADRTYQLEILTTLILQALAAERAGTLELPEVKELKKALEKIDSGFCEGNNQSHVDCERWMVSVARSALSAFENLKGGVK